MDTRVKVTENIKNNFTTWDVRTSETGSHNRTAFTATTRTAATIGNVFHGIPLTVLCM